MSESPRHQFTIRQVMIGVGILGSMLGLGARAIAGDGAVISLVGIALFTFPMWGAFVLALFRPAVTRRLFRACLLIGPLVGGYFLIRFATDTVPNVLPNFWLSLYLWVLSTIVTFGFGHRLSIEMRQRAPGASR
jgi:Na+/proline symporter